MTTRKDPWFRNRLIRDGIYEAIYGEMKRSKDVYIMGEGSHMKMRFDAKHIIDEFPDRVITLPISEDANTNFAVGMSLAGIVPIVDVISSDFLYRTMDAVCNTAAKGCAVGRPATIVVRAEFMTGGATSGQRIEALFAHVPGLHVVVPSNAVDAYLLMRGALNRKGVTVFFEDREISDASTPSKYKNPCMMSTSQSGAQVALLHASGPTVVSYGLTLRTAEIALANETCTLIDLRSLYPLDIATIIQHARRSMSLLVVEPDSGFLGIGAEVIAQVAEKLPGCRVRRLAGPHATIPASRELHDSIVPDQGQILTAVREMS